MDSNIDLPNNEYDTVVAVGVLTHGHAPPESLDGILKITKPGGVIVFSLSKIANDDLGFGEKISELDASGKWDELHRSRLFRTYPFHESEAHINHWVCVYQKLENID